MYDYFIKTMESTNNNDYYLHFNNSILESYNNDNHYIGEENTINQKNLAITFNNYIEDIETFLFKLFLNQRKMYRYLKYLNQLNEEEIDEDTFFEKIETCVIEIETKDKDKVISYIKYLFDLCQKFDNRELDFFTDEELSYLLSIPLSTIPNLKKEIE